MTFWTIDEIMRVTFRTFFDHLWDLTLLAMDPRVIPSDFLTITVCSVYDFVGRLRAVFNNLGT